MVSQPPPTGVCLVFESGRPATGGAAGDGDRTAHGRFGQTGQIGVATELLPSTSRLPLLAQLVATVPF